MFYSVQDILDGRRDIGVHGQKNVLEEAILLKGFLICPNCNSKLFASASKGCRNYYHCNSSCGFRSNAKKVNELFLEELKRLSLNPVIANLYAEVVEDVFEQQTGAFKNDVRLIINQFRI